MNRPSPQDSVWALIENSQDIIIVIERDGSITFVNQAVEPTLGYKPEELIGANAFDLIHEADREDIRERFASVIEQPGHATDRVQYRLYHHDGSIRWVESIGSNQYDTALDGFVINTRDITEHKEIESALRERNKELEALHFTANLFANRTTPIESLFEEFVHNFPQWFQYPEQTEVCISFNDILVESAAFDPDHVRITSEMNTPDKQPITIDIGYSAGIQEIQFLEEERQLVSTIATFLGEAIGRRQQEVQLILFKRAVEEAGHAVMITNDRGTIEYVNPEFEAQTGYKKEEAVGSTPRIVKSGKHDQAFYEQLWETILSGRIWTADLVNRRKDGSLYFVDQSIAPISNAEDEIVHFVAIESEVTQRRLREQKIQVLNRILRHNLRNSLNVIDGHISIIEDEIEESTLNPSVEAIKIQVDQLISISEKSAQIRDLFDTDDDGYTVCDLSKLIRELETDLREKYPNVNLSFDYPPKANVRGDYRLKVALEEAIENAIVHNDHAEPSVTITVGHSDTSPQKGGIEVYVSDNGPGISESERSVIEAGGETPLEHGSSIGLWVIVWIVSNFGGEVSIENQNPRGTRLILHLPGPSDGK